MNSILFYPEELVSDNVAVVTGERARYLKEFHDLREGEVKNALLFRTGKGEAECLSATGSEYQFRVAFQAERDFSFPSISLLQGICRPQTIKKVLQYSAMLRLREVYLVPTAFGQKSYRQSKMLREENQQYEIVKGLEQVGNPFPPEIILLDSFESHPVVGENYEVGLLAAPGEGGGIERYIEQKSTFPSSLLLAIGPESGWSDEEVSSFHSSGYTDTTLGSDHLRVEVALSALLGQIALWDRMR